MDFNKRPHPIPTPQGIPGNNGPVYGIVNLPLGYNKDSIKVITFPTTERVNDPFYRR